MNSIAIVMLLWQQGESAADPHRWSVRIGQAVGICRPCHVAKVTYFCFTSSVLFFFFLGFPFSNRTSCVYPSCYYLFFSFSRCSAEVIAFSELVSFLCPFIPSPTFHLQSVWRRSDVLCASSCLTSPQLLPVTSGVTCLFPTEFTW